MKEDEMLMCLIAFVLGYLVARMIRGNGLTSDVDPSDCLDTEGYCPKMGCVPINFPSYAVNHEMCYGK